MLAEQDEPEPAGKLDPPSGAERKDISARKSESSRQPTIATFSPADVVVGEQRSHSDIFPHERTAVKPPAELGLNGNQLRIDAVRLPVAENRQRDGTVLPAHQLHAQVRRQQSRPQGIGTQSNLLSTGTPPEAPKGNEQRNRNNNIFSCLFQLKLF